MNNRIVSILVLVVLIGLAAFFISRSKDEPTAVKISNFAQCQQAGGAITTSGTTRTCTPSTGECCFTEETAKVPDVVVETPVRGDLATSPLRVKGKAKGTWYFEANLPVVLKDQNGKVLTQKGFQALGDWMTTDYVDFDDVLVFPTPTTEFGNLIISKDNPSGLPENDAEIVIPLRFK